MSILTNHAKRRMFERGNITHDCDARKNASRAIKNGIRHSETTGEVHKWLDGLFLYKRNGTNMRIYRGYLYLFKSEVLITFFKLPDRITSALPDCVSDKVYRRYTDYQLCRDKRRDSKKSDREKEDERALKNAFWNNIIISDIEEAFPNLPARIYGIHFDKNRITVFFVPDNGDRPELTMLMDYLKDCYGYRSVYLKHMRDGEGKLMYGQDKESFEAETVYSSEESVTAGVLRDLLTDITL